MTAPGALGSACSRVWDGAQIPAWGSAARADVVVALEQNGPWGRQAATQSRLDPALGAALDSHLLGLGGRLLLIRRPGRHADGQAPTGSGDLPLPHAPEPSVAFTSRRCYVARTGPRGWLVRTELADPAQLLGLTQAVLKDASSAIEVVGGAVDHRPILLVCTNGRRDVCCATRGREITNAVSSVQDDLVWETSHTGGHRFAPTGVLLPWGRMLARLDPALAAASLQWAHTGQLAPSVLGPVHDRGSMHLPPAAQAAEAWLRLHEHRVLLADPVSDASERVTVAVERGPALLESCGKAAVDSTIFAPRLTEPSLEGPHD